MISPHPAAQPAAKRQPLPLRLLAFAAGAAVANSYYNQAFLGHLDGEFGSQGATVALVPVLSQAGNALGILFLAPLGDVVERKSLILATTTALTLSLVLAASSPGFVWLLAASMAVGLFATLAQQLVPLAVHLAPPGQSGRVLGVVTGGILTGILLARAFSGVVSDFLGWAAVFWAAAALMAAVGIALALRLPRVRPAMRLGYSALLASLWGLLRTHPALRRSIAIQFLIFAAFIGFWSTLALYVASPPFGFGGTAVGLLALIGAAGALTAPVAGRLIDRHGTDGIVTAGIVLVGGAFAVFALTTGGLLGLIAGILLLDIGVQASQIANQTRVYALDPLARSRLNTVFMATMLTGGAFGAGVAGLAYSATGWGGVCVFGALMAGLALAVSRLQERVFTPRT